MSESPPQYKVAKAFNHVCIVEDDFGFSILTAISFTQIGAKGFEHIGKMLSKTDLLNKQTKDTGLEYEDAMLIAMNVETFMRQQRQAKEKKKRKS